MARFIMLAAVCLLALSQLIATAAAAAAATATATATAAAGSSVQARRLLSSNQRGPGCPCARIYKPVCGVDGRAYPNKCVAQCAGVQITDPNPPNPQACNRIAVLPPGPTTRPTGTSSSSSSSGLGQRRLHSSLAQQQRGPAGLCRCPRIYLPVCGSDSNSYNSKCEAECKGVTITGERPVNGQCNSGPGPVEPSGPGFNPSGPSTRPWFQGNGNPQPGPGRACACPLILAPVCGSDGQTHSNSCVARCKGVTVASQGNC